MAIRICFLSFCHGFCLCKLIELYHVISSSTPFIHIPHVNPGENFLFFQHVPVFWVVKSAQLFITQNSGEAEPEHCSVALSRGPDCPGIKRLASQMNELKLKAETQDTPGPLHFLYQPSSCGSSLLLTHTQMTAVAPIVPFCLGMEYPYPS